MGRIPDDIIQRVRDQADIVELVGRTVSLKRAGRSYKGLCPFHHEKTPSFHVNPDRGSYYCFGCQEGGDAFAFLMKTEGLQFHEAVRSLAKDCNIEVPETGRRDGGQSEAIFAANDLAQATYRKALASEDNPVPAYLTKRGLSEEDATRFEVGFAPDRWDTVAQALRQGKVAADIGEKAGLLAPRQRGDGFYDRLRGRLTFPIRDARGRVIGFGGRALGEGQEPKYLNTPESPVFRKRESFYGLPEALAPIRQNDRAVVVEGYFDRIALARAGVEESLATCGTALSEGHARHLRRRTRNVVLLYDGDEAGQKAMERSLEVLLPEGLRVRAALLPAGADPDDLLREQGPEALRAVVDEAPAALDFVIERAVGRGCATPWEKADAVASVAPLLAKIPSGVERSEFAQRLALSVGTEVRHVEDAVRAASRGEDARDAVPVAPRMTGAQERKLRQLARSLVDHPSLAARVPRDEVAELVPAGPLRELIRALVEAAAEDRSVRVEELAENLSDNSAQLLRQLAVAEDVLEADIAERTIDDTLIWLRKQHIKEQLHALTLRLRDPNADVKAILEEKQRLTKQRLAATHPVGSVA
ncbi:MAG: DNA primase [Myxococcota bacterium]